MPGIPTRACESKLSDWENSPPRSLLPKTIIGITGTTNVCNEQIKAVDSQKLLGIIIDKSLTWDKQIDAVCLNVTRRITLLIMTKKSVKFEKNQHN